jgi:hypothetical protein
MRGSGVVGRRELKMRAICVMSSWGNELLMNQLSLSGAGKYMFAPYSCLRMKNKKPPKLVIATLVFSLMM